MSYRRIEVNLLPPELQPGPAVRSALIINIALILITAFVIILSAALSIYQYAQYNDDIKKRRMSIDSLQSVKDGYQQLQRIDSAVGNYGKIVGIASTNYIDLPVMLSHLSGLLPDKVYLTDVSNLRGGNVNAVSVLDANRPTFVTMTCRTATKDLGLIQRTLATLKEDPIFANCVLTNATLDSEELTDLAELLGIAGTFEFPDTFEGAEGHEFYEFIIRAEVRRPLPLGEHRMLSDQLALFRRNEGLPDNAPLDAPAAPAAGNAAGSPAASPERGVSGGPEGVTGSDNRGGN
ncbi:hypothetical protein KDL44_00050 [bacterium]|nr:hypothetical protein [bacterium]